MQPLSQHARMNVQLPSHGLQAATVPRGCNLQSHRAPKHASTDEQPVIVPNDEPSSQGYQESCIHSACAEDAVVPPIDHALKARWH